MFKTVYDICANKTKYSVVGVPIIKWFLDEMSKTLNYRSSMLSHVCHRKCFIRLKFSFMYRCDLLNSFLNNPANFMDMVV